MEIFQYIRQFCNIFVIFENTKMVFNIRCVNWNTANIVFMKIFLLISLFIGKSGKRVIGKILLEFYVLVFSVMDFFAKAWILWYTDLFNNMRMQGVNPWSREMFQSIRYANNTKVNSVKTKEDADYSRSAPFMVITSRQTTVNCT